MTFTPFQKYIKRAAAQYGIATEINAAKVCHTFRLITPEIFANLEDPDTYISPAHYKNKTLTISVENPAWAQQVIMRKEKIIQKINDEFSKEVIKNLRTQLKKNDFTV